MPIPDEVAGPKEQTVVSGTEGKVSKRAEDVFSACNFFIKALLSGDAELIEIAEEQWQKLADDGEK